MPHGDFDKSKIKVVKKVELEKKELETEVEANAEASVKEPSQRTEFRAKGAKKPASEEPDWLKESKENIAKEKGAEKEQFYGSRK